MLVGANDTDGAEEETATGVEVGTGLVGRGLGRELIEGERLVDGMEVGSPLKMTVSTSILWGYVCFEREIAKTKDLLNVCSITSVGTT